MHVIQKQIVYQLILRPECRYRDIKPKDVEGNLFMYHLRQLFKSGLAEKTSDGRYRLTASGSQLADILSLKSVAPRIQPKIVTLITVQNDDNEWLLYKRGRQPFHGLVGFPYGKIHLGETIQQAAERELQEKTGLAATLTHRGDVYLTIKTGNVVVSQMLCHIFSGRNPAGKLKKGSEIGQCFWAKIDPQATGYFPGFAEIYQQLASRSGHFFTEIVVQST